MLIWTNLISEGKEKKCVFQFQVSGRKFWIFVEILVLYHDGEMFDAYVCAPSVSWEKLL